MTRRHSALAILSIALATVTTSHAQDAAVVAAAAKGAADTSEGIGVRGADANWWFLKSELQHIATGDFAADFSKSSTTATDPTAEIVRYSEDVKANGARLILVPVPAKASVHPDKLAAGATSAPGASGFLKALAAAGVEVVDLEPVLRELSATTAPYCQQDSHWSPAGCQTAAKAIAAKIRESDAGFLDTAKSAFGQPIVASGQQELEVHGDLIPDSEKASVAKEKLSVVYVGIGDAAAPAPIAIDKSSPVVLVGDSHTLVFNEGAGTGMHSQGAGIADHLAMELGFPCDREASKGSGSYSARANVARRSAKEDIWAEKKVIIWLFSAREFTQGKWSKVPANVKKK